MPQKKFVLDHHQHQHSIPKLENLSRAFIIGIGLNLAYVVLQIIIGFSINSLSILSDAGHNFLDVAGLSLSLFAIKIGNSKSSEKYTYGYKKSTILVSLLNAIVLLISIGAIGYAAILRFAHPEPIPGKTVAIIAAIGLLINGFSANLFFKEKDKDINVKSAFLHLLSDTLVSFGLILGGVLIYFTNLSWIDPMLSIIICLVIIASTWSLLKDSIRLSLDGVPKDINFEKVRKFALLQDGVIDFHHIHIWAVSTTENALTGHLVVSSILSAKQIQTIKSKVKHELLHHKIQHCTLEIESENDLCPDGNC